MRTMAFTGHRPNDFGGYNEESMMIITAKYALSRAINKAIARGYTRFISGMALGVDTWAAEAVLKAKEEFPDIKLIAAIPMLYQYQKWPEPSQQRWHNIVSKADEIYVTSFEMSTEDKLLTYSELCDRINEKVESGEVLQSWSATQWLCKRNHWMVDHCETLFGVWTGKKSGGTYECLEYARKSKVKTVVYDPTLITYRVYYLPEKVKGDKMIYAIGDIHGKRDMLKITLDWIKKVIKPEDTVVFVGDYIDRGEDSKGVVDDVMAFCDEHPNTECLMGNHECMMISAYDEMIQVKERNPDNIDLGHEFDLWSYNGGLQTMVSYGVDVDSADIHKWYDKIPQDHWDWYRALEIEYPEGEYLFVHAGVLPEGAYWGYGTHLDPRQWVRDEFLNFKEPLEENRIIVFGHTPQKSGKPLVMFNKIGIDTGGVFGGMLTTVVLDPESRGNDRINFEYHQSADFGTSTPRSLGLKKNVGVNRI